MCQNAFKENTILADKIREKSGSVGRRGGDYQQVEQVDFEHKMWGLIVRTKN